MATEQTTTSTAHVGDWIEARSVYGQSPRRGQIIELVGRDRHQRYRVRWDEKHESILYPADGVAIIPRQRAIHRGRR